MKAFGKLSVKRKEYIRKTKGMPKGARREIEGKLTGKAIGTPKENRRPPVENQRKVRRKTKLKPTENIGNTKESERKPNGKPKGNKGNPKENERTPRAAGSSQKHPQAISSKKQPGIARTSEEQPEAARSSQEQPEADGSI